MRPPTLEELLPIAPPMLWLDEVVGFDASAGEAAFRLTVRSEHPFVEDGAAPALFSLEWMTQAAHALSALVARSHALRLGPCSLATVSEAHFSLRTFALGDLLVIHAIEERDSHYRTRVERAGQVLCTARLSLRERS
jgi:predicted hotdog family 3-hydroxylacyl-ACP dehydratase